ncbi:MAG: efflux RND transporter periplasmic adaptor subunit [Pseudomonadota bacterium]
MMRLIVAILAGLLAAQPATAQQPPASVVVDAVSTAPVVQSTPVLGRVVARDALIATQVNGVVKTVVAVIGDAVAKGDKLIELDAARLEADLILRRSELEVAKANTEAARADVTLRRQAFERVQNLRDSSAFSQAQFEDAAQELRRAESLLNVSEAREESAEADLAIAQLDLDDALIRAPFDGVVIERMAHVGEYLRVGDPILVLINAESLEFEAQVPAQRVAGLTNGTEVPAVFETGAAVTSTVRAVLPVVNVSSRTRTVRFEAELESLGLTIANNQSVTLEIPNGSPRDALTVHKDAIIQGPRGATVFIVGEENSAEIRPIQIGAAVGDRFEAISGLAEGDLAVVRGNERLRPGQTIAFEPPGGDEAPAAAETAEESPAEDQVGG